MGVNYAVQLSYQTVQQQVLELPSRLVAAGSCFYCCLSDYIFEQEKNCKKVLQVDL